MVLFMKLWIDDVRIAPEGYIWCKSVNEAKRLIQENEEIYNKILNEIRVGIINDEIEKGSVEENELWKKAGLQEITLIDIDHDAGDFVDDGGDYIKLLDWLEETERNYPIKIHSMNVVGVANMRRIIEKNGWKEIR